MHYFSFLFKQCGYEQKVCASSNTGTEVQNAHLPSDRAPVVKSARLMEQKRMEKRRNADIVAFADFHR